MSDKKYVSYEEFGAVGDGVTDDFDAIEAAHLYANEHNLVVKPNKEATYYVGAKLTREIPIECDVDFNDAHFVIDDNVPNAYQYKNVALFALRRKSSVILEGEELIKAIGEGVTIRKGDTSFDWLAPILTEDSFVVVTNSEHRDFVRFGSNENKGVSRHDIFEVMKDGTLDPETDVAYEFDKITKLEIYPAREKPITVKNGNFASICCRTVAETDFMGRWHGYMRGFVVERADVTFENITHRMINEPDLRMDKDELAKIYGGRDESYPYVGFIVSRRANRLTLKDCILTSRTTYYEDKPATVSTGGRVPAPVPLGSYDMYFITSNRVSLIRLKQECPTGIGDSRYWGIMASNNCKNFFLDTCYMNRFDAHQGFWNTKIVNSTIGHSINITGGGHLYMENVVKLRGPFFMSIRGDYGGSFEGDIVLKNCRLDGKHAYNSTREDCQKTYASYTQGYIICPGASVPADLELFYNWDFGYELYLPKAITIDGFTHGISGDLYVYSKVEDMRFVNNCKHHHRVTEKIIFKNMDIIPKTTTPDGAESLLLVPVEIQ